MIRNKVQPPGNSEEISGIETYYIWNETGFLPPKYYIFLIEMLHHADSSGYTIPDSLILHAIKNLENETLSGRTSFLLYSYEKMIYFAEICGICNINSEKSEENYLMSKITESLISDYLRTDKRSNKPEKEEPEEIILKKDNKICEAYL